MKRSFLLAALFTAVIAGEATASTLTLTLAGEFGGGISNLGGVPLAAGTPFILEATFDPTADTELSLAKGVFLATLVTLLINGTTYTATPASSVVLWDPFAGSDYVVGFLSNNNNGFAAIFDTATPPIDADLPGPTVFSDLSDWGILGGVFSLNLADDAGVLFIDNSNDALTVSAAALTSSAEVPAEVPEPTSLLLFGSGALGVLAKVRRRKQQ